jgi:predicted negative regulator of RcsB-dependent stress response
VTAHLTEEEQLEALKRWWNENGKSTIAAIALAVGGYFGWQGWQNQQQQQAEAASAMYQDLLEAAVVEPGQSLSESDKATATHLAGSLKSDHASSLYASQAALLMAKVAVEEARLEDAAAELEWVLAQKPGAEVELMTSLRLARIAIAQQDYTKAQSLLTKPQAELGSFAAAYAEVRGDAYLAQGEADLARSEYQQSLQLLAAGSSRRQILEMKINDIQAAPEVVAVQGEE